ncbi:MAG: hypothetical protein ABIJ92_00310 [Candidatus Aenigmatarchaeota archaeon]
MKRIKKFRIPLSDDTILDVKIEVEKGEVSGFALNLRCRMSEVWREVYRVDTAHDYLHEQKYWLSEKPIPLKQETTIQYAFEHYMEQIRKNFERYKKYYLEKKGG